MGRLAEIHLISAWLIFRSSARETKTSSPAETGTFAPAAPSPKRRWSPNASTLRPWPPPTGQMTGSQLVKTHKVGDSQPRYDASVMAEVETEAWNSEPEPLSEPQPPTLPPQPWVQPEVLARSKGLKLTESTFEAEARLTNIVRKRTGIRADLINEFCQASGSRISCGELTLRFTILQPR